MKKKDVLTINDSVYNESDEHVYTISDSRKQVDARNYQIKDTHIVDGVHTISFRVRLFEPAFIRIIRKSSTPLSTNLVTHVLTISRE